MTRHLKTIVTVGALAAAMAFAQTTSTTAAPAAVKGAGLKAKVQKQLIKALDLTAAQKQQAKTILQAAKQQAQPLVAQLKQGRQDLSAAVQAGDTAKIQQVAQQVGALQGQVLAIRAQGKAQFFALLTPDQKVKAADFQQKLQQVLGAKGE